MQYGDLARVYDLLAYDIPYDAWNTRVQSALAGCRSVAELGCGTGNMTVRLARAFNVTALDISPEMLEIASEKLRGAGLSARLVEGDMRTFSLHRPLDAVVCFCDGVNYLTSAKDAEAAFRSVYRALKPGGVFLFDISGEKKLRDMDEELYSEDTDEVTYLWRNAFDEKTRCLTMDLTFFCAEDGHYRRFDEQHVQRAHRIGELLELLQKTGFSARATADYTEKPATDASPRISFFCKREESDHG